MVAQVGTPCEVLLSPEAELHRPPRAERQQALAPVPAVVVGSLAGEDAEVDGRVVVVRGVIDARGLVARQCGSGGGGEAQLQHVVPPQEALNLQFMLEVHVAAGEDALAVEPDLGKGVEAAEVEVLRGLGELAGREGEAEAIGPVQFADPLHAVLVRPVAGVGEQALTDEVLLDDAGDGGGDPALELGVIELPARMEV